MRFLTNPTNAEIFQEITKPYKSALIVGLRKPTKRKKKRKENVTNIAKKILHPTQYPSQQITHYIKL